MGADGVAGLGSDFDVGYWQVDCALSDLPLVVVKGRCQSQGMPPLTLVKVNTTFRPILNLTNNMKPSEILCHFEIIMVKLSITLTFLFLSTLSQPRCCFYCVNYILSTRYSFLFCLLHPLLLPV